MTFEEIMKPVPASIRAKRIKAALFKVWFNHASREIGDGTAAEGYCEGFRI